MPYGLRRGELAVLTWNDVDLKARTITINKTMEYPPNRPPKLRPLTKTATGMRTVDMPQRLADYMAELPRDYLLDAVVFRGSPAPWGRASA